MINKMSGSFGDQIFFVAKLSYNGEVSEKNIFIKSLFFELHPWTRQNLKVVYIQKFYGFPKQKM